MGCGASGASEPARHSPPAVGQNTVVLSVTVPDGAGPGFPLNVQAPDGCIVQVAVPYGVRPGQQFNVGYDPVTLGAAGGQVPQAAAQMPPSASSTSRPSASTAPEPATLPPSAAGMASMLSVPVPNGAGPGTELTVLTPEGYRLKATVPDGVGPGQEFRVSYDPATLGATGGQEPQATRTPSSTSWPAAPVGQQRGDSSRFVVGGVLGGAFGKATAFKSKINSQMDAALANHESGTVSSLLDSALATKMMGSGIVPASVQRAAAQVASRQLGEAIASEDPKHIKGALISAGRLNARHVPEYEQATQAYQRLKQLPPGWDVSKMALDRQGDKMVAKLTIKDGDTFARLQRLLDLTHRKVYTRDRMGEDVPERLHLVSANVVTNDELWADYVTRREWVRQDAAKQAVEEYPVETTSSIDPQPLEPGESAEEISAVLAYEFGTPLMRDVNEVFLWHGTSQQAADSITTSDFKLNMAGSNAGTLYGRGLYLAENASKSDEYSKPNESQIRYMLLCRTTLGRAKYIDTTDVDPRTCEDACLKGDFHSILGDRKKARGTFREFIVFDEDQVYPSFILAYRRVAATESVAQTVAVTVPAGVGPGDILEVKTPSGLIIQVQVPAGVAPGDVFHARY